jgi:hypothetical protein
MIKSREIRSGMAFCFLITALSAQTQAQVRIVPDLYVDAVGNSFSGPFVNSFARAVLYNTIDGSRAYTTQVIIGHQVINLTYNRQIYQARIVSDIGYANNFASHLPAVWSQCYAADMAVHVNAYSLHEMYSTFGDCVEPPPPNEDSPDPPDENCPVILDLRQDGFHLSGPNPAVLFDIDADGVKDPIAWTKANDDDAFLCMDRNRNGLIDDGTELFGYATPLRNGQPAKVGYRALAELDSREAGGNRDGVVDASDAMFADLCVWVDRNRDGASQPEEISSLPQVGVAALEYRYRVTRLRDSYGNLFRYVSMVRMRTPSGALQPWPSFDVIFAEP